MYTKITNNISVTVVPVYLEEYSAPDQSHYVWAYHVRIENKSDDPVKLHSRYWKIADSFGRVQEVSGAGVVGEQPTLLPGQIFEYTSGTPLNAPSGVMMGQYFMMRDDGQQISVDIPAFSLDSPYQPMVLN